MQHATVITGAASGAGAALVRRIAAPGAALLLHTGHNAAGLDAVADAARVAGAEVATCVEPFETGDARIVIAAALAAFGRVDRLVHVAGGADPRGFGTVDQAGFQRAVAVNAGAFLAMATVLPHAVSRVVTVGSFLAHAYRLGPDYAFPATAAAKAALVSLTRSLAARLAPGATVNCVVPGFIAKDPGRSAKLDPAARSRALAHIPLGRFGQPDEVAGVIAFLLGPDGAYLTGQCIHVDGGVTL